MFPRNENRNEGTFAKTTLLEPPFYLPVTLFGVDKRVVSKRVVLADVPPERKLERGYIRQNHPFTKPPFYLPVSFDTCLTIFDVFSLHEKCRNLSSCFLTIF